eukprot:scaffold6862_cov92-Skeletonema_dohrnii-CCMP3373.AAC.5
MNCPADVTSRSFDFTLYSATSSSNCSCLMDENKVQTRTSQIFTEEGPLSFCKPQSSLSNSEVERSILYTLDMGMDNMLAAHDVAAND